MSGQMIDEKYCVLRMLGKGGMGSVFEAQHIGTGRRVAVKLIGSALKTNAEMVTRFQREAKALGAIETQHIVQVLDLGTDAAEGLPYMVMELLSGIDLEQQLKRCGPLPPELALRIVAQACIGLHKAHAARIVHRDIKPANLFLADRDEGEVIVKLLDFGIAQLRIDEGGSTELSELTRTGAMIGTPHYMSPEQAKASKSLDHRTDIWSLGVVLYKALSGKTPHHRYQTLGELTVAICVEPAPPLRDLAPWVPPEIAAIVHAALRIDPAERFQSAEEMLAAIRAHLPSGWGLRKELLAPMSAREASPLSTRSPATMTTPTVLRTTAPALSRSTAGAPADARESSASVGRRALIASASAAALVAIGAGTTLVSRGDARSEPAPAASSVLPESTTSDSKSAAGVGIPGPVVEPSAVATAAPPTSASSNGSAGAQSVSTKVPLTPIAKPSSTLPTKPSSKRRRKTTGIE